MQCYDPHMHFPCHADDKGEHVQPVKYMCKVLSFPDGEVEVACIGMSLKTATNIENGYGLYRRTAPNKSAPAGAMPWEDVPLQFPENVETPEEIAACITATQKWIDSETDPVKKASLKKMLEPSTIQPVQPPTPEQAALYRQQSARRASKNLRHKLQMIRADRMLTFTVRGASSSIDALAKAFKECVRLFKIRYPDFEYAGSPERHKSQGYHLHVGINSRIKIDYMLRCWELALGVDQQAVTDWYVHGKKLGELSRGAVNITYKKGASKRWKAAQMSKYICKSMSESLGDDADLKSRRRVWASKGIGKPTVLRCWLNSTNQFDMHAEYSMIRNGLIDVCHRLGDLHLPFLEVWWFHGSRSQDSNKSLDCLSSYVPIVKPVSDGVKPKKLQKKPVELTYWQQLQANYSNGICPDYDTDFSGL